MKKALSIILATLLLLTSCTNNQISAPKPDTELQTPSDNQTPTLAQTRCETLDFEMKNASAKIGVAYLGFYEYGTLQNSLDYFKSGNPDLQSKYSIFEFLTPQSVIGENVGEGYCIYVADKDTSIAINRIDENGEVSEILYKGNPDTPLLVFANGDTFSPDTQIVTIDGDFSLCLDHNGRLTESDVVYDFTNYGNIVKELYTVAKDNFYIAPTKETLVNTSWEGQTYVSSEITKTYILDFFENTVKIHWNDGIDAEDHEFEAIWSLSEKDGVCVLNLNLDNLDGERTYVPLVTETNDTLYILSDFVNGDVHRDYEKLNVMLVKTVG